MSSETPPNVMVTVYGKPKQKKTSDALAAFPRALFLGVPSAITLVAQNELGFTPSVHADSPKNLPELVSMLKSFAELRDKETMTPSLSMTQVTSASALCWSGKMQRRRDVAARKISSTRTNS